jgi:hypothetical protein
MIMIELINADLKKISVNHDNQSNQCSIWEAIFLIQFARCLDRVDF